MSKRDNLTCECGGVATLVEGIHLCGSCQRWYDPRRNQWINGGQQQLRARRAKRCDVFADDPTLKGTKLIRWQ